MYYLPYRASVKGEYRHYTDTWGVDAWNAEIGYVHPLPKGFTAELRLRYYQQSEADFFADLFDRPISRTSSRVTRSCRASPR
jgi:hypothetical protein